MQGVTMNGYNTNGFGLTSCDEDLSYKLLSEIVLVLKDCGVLAPSRDELVVDFLHPRDLIDQIDLSLDNTPISSTEKLIKVCKDVIQHSVKTNHPHFHNQLYSGVDPYGLLGALITEALNTNQYTYEVAPMFTLAEHQIVASVLKLFGYTTGDGIFAPGGSVSNMYGMVLARYKYFPEVKTKGLSCLPPLVAFTSEDAHYSITKAVNWLGIGTDNLIAVKSDQYGRMIPSELAAKIAEAKKLGKVPFFVNATAGTTVLGAVDDIDHLANVCQQNNLWLHVDACWGGSLIFSKKYKHLLQYCNRADSLSWNPHKMLGAPLQCSIFITKHKGQLHQCNSASATYLFQQDKFYDVSYDTGDKSVQCGRKVDGFKLWLMWRARGELGFEKLVDNAMNCSRYFRHRISKRPGFRLVIQDFDCSNVCFWFIPTRLRNKPETDEWWEEIDKVAPKLKEKLTYAGTVMISYQPLKHRGLKNFLRLVNTCHPQRTYEDMDHVITEIEKYGEEM